MIKSIIGFATLADAVLAVMAVYHKDFYLLGIATVLGIGISILALVTYEER